MRIEPLSNVVPYWEHDETGYPSKVRLAMMDGTIQTFWHEVIQPAPVLDRGWTNIGYAVQPVQDDGYIGKHAKKTGGAPTPTGLQT